MEAVTITLGGMKVMLDEFKERPTEALEGLVRRWQQQFSTALTQLMEAELAVQVGEGTQTGAARNGYAVRQYTIKGIGTLEVRVPRDRQGRYRSTVIPPRQRYDARIGEDMALMHLGGMSTRTIAMYSERFWGRSFSAQEVSEATRRLDGEAEAWRTRPLPGAYRYLYVDGTYVSVRRKTVDKEPVLVVIGVDTDGQRQVLGVQTGAAESATNWQVLFEDLLSRGLDPSKVELGMMDGLSGLEGIFRRCFYRAKVQRCQIHKRRNVMAKVPKRLQEAMRAHLRTVFYNHSERASREAFASLKTEFQSTCPSAVACLESDLDALLAFYAFPEAHWPSLRSTNPIERLNKEYKRRTRSMEIVGNEQSLYTLFAFISLRMERHWRSATFGCPSVAYLKNFSLTQKT